MGISRAHRVLLVGVVVGVAVSVFGAVLLWPRDVPEPPPSEVEGVDVVDGRIDDVAFLREDDMGFLPGAIVVDVTATIEETGEQVTFEMVDEAPDSFEAGQRVRLQIMEMEDGELMHQVVDVRRDQPLLWLLALFATAVIGFGRWQGVRALLGLVLTFVVILTFIVPAILAGSNPVAVTLIGAVPIMVLTLYLSHGFSAKTTAAVVGTAAALLITGLLAALFAAATSLTGYTSEEARFLSLEVGGLNLQGLLLAGIILGGLGVLDDVTMSQSSTVFALRRVSPDVGFTDLVTHALSVGRDHVAATVNTLFLAYAGASLPLLILFVIGGRPWGELVTSELVAVEIVRTLVGSVGLIAAVPITTALAAWLVTKRDAEPA